MCSLGASPGVYKQVCGIAFLSSCLSMFFPILSESLWLLFKVLCLESQLGLYLFHSAVHFCNWIYIQDQVRGGQRDKEIQWDSTLSEPQLQWRKRKCFPSWEFWLLWGPITDHHHQSTTWLLEGWAWENRKKKRERERERERNKQRGKGFPHSLLSIRNSISHFRS